MKENVIDILNRLTEVEIAILIKVRNKDSIICFTQKFGSSQNVGFTKEEKIAKKLAEKKIIIEDIEVEENYDKTTYKRYLNPDYKDTISDFLKER